MAVVSSNIGQNQERVFQLLRTGQELTKQDIAKLLHLSMPTTLQNVHDLIEAGILEEGGVSESTGGRKAKKIRLNRTAGLGVGIDIALHQVHFVVTDLLGGAMYSTSEHLMFRDEPDWYQELGAALERFLQSNQVAFEKILGVGISFPGIIDEQGSMIVRSHIFGLEHVSLDRFRRYIPYPIVVSNDANCAAFAELRPEHQTYLYVSLNESVGGALMIRNQLLLGDTWQAGEIGHMLLIPDGETCYCGKRGCADAYLSPKVLTGGKQSIRAFFRKVKAGDAEARAAWDIYLEYLAIFVTNLRMLMDIDLIIGGEVGSCIQPYMDELCKKAAQYDLFARDVDYLYPCMCRQNAFAIGAALLSLERNAGYLLKKPITED